MALKSYTVYFFTKENRTEYLNEVVIEANTAKEACAICKQWYHEKTGKCLTRLDSKEYCNFGYKDMDESCGPYQYDCPVSILNLLSPTEYEYAIEWRKACRENAAKKAAARKDPNSLENLPLNATVKLNRRGEEILLQKAKIAGRKRPVWVSWSDRVYYTAAQVKTHGYQLHSVA